jgi:hypothetical protein
VTLSSTEAGYFAASETGMEHMFVNGLILGLRNGIVKEVRNTIDIRMVTQESSIQQTDIMGTVLRNEKFVPPY